VKIGTNITCIYIKIKLKGGEYNKKQVVQEKPSQPYHIPHVSLPLHVFQAI
jgi:hypothetical protein